jgi:hypothetical protein
MHFATAAPKNDTRQNAIAALDEIPVSSLEEEAR